MDTTSIPESESTGNHHHNHGEGTHSVQFYWDDTYVLDKLSQTIGEALATGGAAIVIGTDGHRSSLAQRLMERDLDCSLAAQEGRYLALDAAETLAKFMV